MSGFFSKSPASDWTKRRPSTGDGFNSENGRRDGPSYDWDGPTGQACADSTLFEESGQYGNVFILRLSEFLKAFGAHSPRTLASMQLICDLALREAVGPQGNYSLHGGAFFVFRFGRVPDAVARRRARKVVNEIGRRLLGDHFVPFPPETEWSDTPAEAATDVSRKADQFLTTLREEAREAADCDWEVLPAAERGPVGETPTGDDDTDRVERAAREEARDATLHGGEDSAGTASAGRDPKASKAAER